MNYIIKQQIFISFLFKFYLLIYLIINCINAEQRIIEEPKDTIVRIGENVLLKCRVKNQKGHVHWLKGEIGLGHKRDMPLFERMSMVGNIEEGEFDLEIKNVSLADDDNYRCQLTPTDDELPKISKRAHLTVIVEPKPPLLIGESIVGGINNLNKQIIGQFNQIAATEGYPIQVNCQSRGGRPPAQINWVLAEDWQAKRILANIVNNNNNDNTTIIFKQQNNRVPFPSSVHPLRHSRLKHLTANITEFRDLDGDSQLYSVISHLNFLPSRDDNGHFLVCMATHEAYGKDSKTASISLDVFYPPKVIIEIENNEENNGKIKELSSINLICRSDSRPNEDLKYNWKWEGEHKRLELLSNNRISINSLRFNDNLKNINCTVENSVGSGSASFQLNIAFGPRFMSTNQTKIIDRGSETTFQCEVLGNPPPIVRWYHGREMDMHIHEGINFTIKNAQDWEEGEYRCIAQVEDFSPKILYHQLYLKGPPKVRFIEYSLSENGKDITLICEVLSRVLPINIQWFHNNIRMDILENKGNNIINNNNEIKNNRFQVKDEKFGKFKIISKMTIFDFIEQDLGLWNCSARNDYGIIWEEKNIKLIGLFDKIEYQWREMPFQLRIVLGSALFCVFAVLFLLILVWLFWRGCCCCNRRIGHSKMSNHSSYPIKCEPVDGMTASESCGTPPYPQQYFYNNNDNGFTIEQQQQQYSSQNIHHFPTTTLNDQKQILFEQQQQQQSYGNNCGYYCEENNNNNLIFEQQQINGRRSSASTTFNYNNGNIYCPSSSMQLTSFDYQQSTNNNNNNGIIQNGIIKNNYLKIIMDYFHV
ncbi:hypothetical protein Mgra_00008852 [Meloidogyne graminicola]|uniref:Ig-like domain-containing protein n=1 Tax=Meloidogyne graminicola TaxID=189291 RepID=A0A8S9ZEI8_9BILA|nr:hypothetical protein Mgra_00008852 [Meloidogyne graminicola]